MPVPCLCFSSGSCDCDEFIYINASLWAGGKRGKGGFVWGRLPRPRCNEPGAKTKQLQSGQRQLLCQVSNVCAYECVVPRRWRQVSPSSTCTWSKSIINKWLIMHDFGAFTRYQHAHITFVPPRPTSPPSHPTPISCATFLVFRKLFVAFDSLTFRQCDSPAFYKLQLRPSLS